MKKIVLIVFFIFGFIFPGKAQLSGENSKTFGKFNIKLHYSNVTSKQIVPIYINQPITLEERFYNKIDYYGFEGLYKFNNLLSAGVYFGYSKGTFISNEMELTDSNTVNFTMDRLGSSCFYGVKGEMHLLPLLFKSDKLRFDVYSPIRLGLVSQSITTFKTNTISWDKPAFEIGAGLGLGYHFTKNIGVYGESLFGRFYNERNSQGKVGLVLSF